MKKKKDSELFRPLVVSAEKYLRDFCDGKQQDEEKAKISLQLLSLYRRILRVEKERDQIRSEWQKLIAGMVERRRLIHPPVNRKKQKSKKSHSKDKERDLH